MKFLCLVALAIMVMFSAMLLSAATCPSKIFEQAKGVALGGTKSPDGTFEVKAQVIKDGRTIVYAVGWLPEEKIVGGMIIVPQQNQALLICYSETEGKFGAALFINGQCVDRQEVTQEQADKIMKEILDNLPNGGCPI